jgi:hypothetical protein
MKATDKASATILAKAIAAICVRNGFLEDLHCRVTPSSKSRRLLGREGCHALRRDSLERISRINDMEMKRLIKGVVNQIYTFLSRKDDPAFLESFINMGSRYAARWDEPEAIEPRVTPSGGSSKTVKSHSKTKKTGVVSRPPARRKSDK